MLALNRFEGKNCCRWNVFFNILKASLRLLCLLLNILKEELILEFEKMTFLNGTLLRFWVYCDSRISPYVFLSSMEPLPLKRLTRPKSYFDKRNKLPLLYIEETHEQNLFLGLNFEIFDFKWLKNKKKKKSRNMK